MHYGVSFWNIISPIYSTKRSCISHMTAWKNCKPKWTYFKKHRCNMCIPKSKVQKIKSETNEHKRKQHEQPKTRKNNWTAADNANSTPVAMPMIIACQFQFI